MAIDNLISVEFTDQELTRLGNALNEIAQVFSGKVSTLHQKNANSTEA